MYTKDQVIQIVGDFLGKTPKTCQPFDITPGLNYDKAYNYIENDIQGSGTVSPAAFPSNKGEVYYFGKLLFSADNELASVAGTNDELVVYLNNRLIVSASTTLHQNQKAVEPFVFDDILFNGLQMYSIPANPMVPGSGTKTSLYFLGWKLTF